MNKVWEIGRLTKEPEIRYTSKKNGNGEEESTVTASYTLAVARGYRHEDGQQDADFFRCVAFGKNAEFAEKYLHKDPETAGSVRKSKRIRSPGCTLKSQAAYGRV